MSKSNKSSLHVSGAEKPVKTRKVIDRHAESERPTEAQYLAYKPVFDTSRTLFSPISDTAEALRGIDGEIRRIGRALPHDQYDEIAEDVFVHVLAYVSPEAKITPPAIICGGASLCHFTHVKCAIVGSFARVGEGSRVSESVLFDRARLEGNNSVTYAVVGYCARLDPGAVVTRATGDSENPPSMSADRPSVNCFKGKRLSGDGISAENRNPTRPQARIASVICDRAVIGANSVVEGGCAVRDGAHVPPLTYIGLG